MPSNSNAPPERLRYIVTPASPARYRPGSSLSLADPIAAARRAIEVAQKQQRPVEVWTSGENDVPIDLLALVFPDGRVDVSRCGGRDHRIPPGMTLAEEIAGSTHETPKPGVWQRRQSAARGLGAICAAGFLAWVLTGGAVVLLVRAVEAAVR